MIWYQVELFIGEGQESSPVNVDICAQKQAVSGNRQPELKSEPILDFR